MGQTTDLAGKSEPDLRSPRDWSHACFVLTERVNTHALVHLGIFSSGVVSGFSRFWRGSSRCGWNRKDLFHCVPGTVPYQHHCRSAQRHIVLAQARTRKSGAGLPPLDLLMTDKLIRPLNKVLHIWRVGVTTVVLAPGQLAIE